MNALSEDVGIILSLVSEEGRCFGFDDISRLYCCADGLPCRDFVHCIWFRDLNSCIVLVWRCPRFKRVRRK